MPKKPAKPKAPRKAPLRVTPVPDRHPDGPLWHEAESALLTLRAYGARPELVPDLRDEAAFKEWRLVRQLPSRHHPPPMWVLDLCAAVLAQIPRRDDRPRGKQADPAVKDVERFATVSQSKIDAARLVAQLEAMRSGMHLFDDGVKEKVEDRAQKLMRKALPSRKRRPAKLKK